MDCGTGVVENKKEALVSLAKRLPNLKILGSSLHQVTHDQEVLFLFTYAMKNKEESSAEMISFVSSILEVSRICCWFLLWLRRFCRSSAHWNILLDFLLRPTLRTDLPYFLTWLPLLDRYAHYACITARMTCKTAMWIRLCCLRISPRWRCVLQRFLSRCWIESVWRFADRLRSLSYHMKHELRRSNRLRFALA